MSYYIFNAQRERERIVKWLREWFERNGKDCNACIGISGGKDSTVTAALCVEALGKDRVKGVLMPNGNQKDIEDSFSVVNALEIEYHIANIEKAYDGIVEVLGGKEQLSLMTLQNLAPRLRMAALYAYSQSHNGRVVNTSNLSETMCGYFTIFGDSCGDVKPLANLTCTEVVEIGKTYTEIPEYLIMKKPSDGLQGNSDDETMLGFKYFDIDRYIRGEGCVDDDLLNMIFKRHDESEFKRRSPDSYIPLRNENMLENK